MIERVEPTTDGPFGTYRCERCIARTWLLYQDAPEKERDQRQFLLCASGHLETLFNGGPGGARAGWPDEVAAMAKQDGWLDDDGNVVITPKTSDSWLE
jgi:hypothetical protein